MSRRARVFLAVLALAHAGCGGEQATVLPDASAPARPPNLTCVAPERPNGPLPARLSKSGCFQGNTPVPALIPYTVNAPLWSDGAEKDRWLALPDGKRIQVLPDGDWELPAGSVLMKTFRFGARPVETRFFARHGDGSWSGWTYAWMDDGSDALLVDEGGGRTSISGAVAWQFPTRDQCLRCHTEAAGFSLGLETGQLDRGEQLARLERLRLFSAAPLRTGAFADPLDARAPIERRARALLHANCAGCHRPEVGDSGAFDLRHDTPLARANVCDQPPMKGNLGFGSDVRLLAPGVPEQSMIALRMHALDSARMPPLASGVVDQAGVQLVEAWIRGLGACVR